MVNSDQFATRLQTIINYYDLSAASFADSIEVGRSSISHILSGRNKPSLDFVLKIIKIYPEVELYWLLNGKGSFPKYVSTEVHSIKKQAEEKDETRDVDIKATRPLPIDNDDIKPFTGSTKKIKRIVLFYEDGTFEAFEN
ncbi:DNA-binding transcriptional regulator, XRE-family HTH domain [Gillisia sp. Hel1_33_143]|uniref:helix-turn-helix transcriptional regulator n=1 Tax=Gillisia sp. Hel1_33_143 TaxID=1336796 RepID=UPI000879F2A3|nr:helix-turn-helix transcriptional regulator [Gillisia sp. Hel1_33_143]SDS51666.1 DNA-binding transcriptional regulator, XRE-family HTH domain [Gillisia sp. Hel1_33_143]